MDVKISERFVRWMFPEAVRGIEESVHELYNSVGAFVEYVIPPLELQSGCLVEGKIPEKSRLKMVARLRLGEIREVEVW